MNKREINMLIAEKVMGWKLDVVKGFYTEKEVWIKSETEYDFVENFNPSTNIKDAWIALDKVCKQHDWRAIIDRSQTWTQVNFKTQMGADSQFLGYRENPIMAICEAVLDSVGIDAKGEVEDA